MKCLIYLDSQKSHGSVDESGPVTVALCSLMEPDGASLAPDRGYRGQIRANGWGQHHTGTDLPGL